jgi:outer membrane cobalamin receptor
VETPVHSIVLAACCLITGNVHAVSGTPLAGAQVALRGAAAPSTTTDAKGDFTLDAAPGTYQLDASARGFAPLSVTVLADHDVSVDVALEPLDSPKLRQIGRVTVDGRLAPIAGTIPSVTLTRADLDRLGDDMIIDGLQTLPGATFSRPDGGGANAIAVVSLRGPDPSESLIALDGQLLNDGNTGDLDLSRLPVAAFSAIDVTEGLGPEDSNGSNTFGGAINLITLRPTQDPHYSLGLSGGSFGRTEAYFNGTGTQGKLGYAIALDDQNESGYVNQTVPLFSTTNPSGCAPCATPLGSSVASHLALADLTYSFSQNADITARVLTLGDNRDQSSAINGIDKNAADIGTPTYNQFVGPGEQTFAQVIRAYQVRARTPLGAGELTTDLSLSDNSVDVNGGTASPYDLIHVDHRYNAGMTWQRTFDTAQFAIGGYTRFESLDFIAPPPAQGNITPFQAEPSLGQTINVFFARGGFQASPKLRLDGGVFDSHYTTFGSNLDGRFGAIYSVDRATSLRFSLGTGFRAPLLIERYEFPYSQLSLDGNNVFVGQGSPGEQPEHATEYELGASHEFAHDATLDVSIYHTNLRDPVEIFYPLAAVAAGACMHNSYADPIPACVSLQSNVGNAVYEGAEVRYLQRFAPAHLFVTAMYGLNVAYPKDLNAQFSNPTSGGNLVDNAQFPGIPQQQGSLQLDWQNKGWHAGAGATFRGNNNELNLAPFTIVNALLGKSFGPHLDLSISGTNLLNAGAGPYTWFGGGVPYRGVTGEDSSGNPVFGGLPTDALHIEPAGVRLILTLRQ